MFEVATGKKEVARSRNFRIRKGVAAATVTGADLRKSYNTECDVPPVPGLASEARSMGSLASVMFELIDNYGADDDAAFDDLLEVSGNIGQVEDVVQHADNESADDGAGYSADTAG